MKTGDIILIPFPYAESNQQKVRPSILICLTKDKYKDLVVSAVSSVVPENLNENEILLNPYKLNGLRTKSVIKVDRIVTIKAENMIANIGSLNKKDLNKFKNKFIQLIQN
jgi:mRNA interferase MazF